MNFTNTLQHNRMGDFSWSEFLAGSAVAKVVEEVVKYRRRKLESTVNMADNARDIADIHRIMESVVEETSYNRFLLCLGKIVQGISCGKEFVYNGSI